MAPTFPGLRVRHLERLALGLRTRSGGEDPWVERASGDCGAVPAGGGCDGGGESGSRHAAAGGACVRRYDRDDQRWRAGERAWEWWHVPKQDLLSTVHLLLEREELRISRGLSETVALVKELVSMRASNGRTGEHGDLVMAVALACWQAGRAMAGPVGRGLPGI